MKNNLKIILTIICWGISAILFFKTLCNFKELEIWKLNFETHTLILGIISILFLIAAILLTKDIIKKNGNNISKKTYKIGLISIIIGIIIIGIVGLVIYNKYPQIENNILYTLTYYDDMTPGSKSDIEIYNNKIEIITTHFCSAVDCKPKIENETFYFSGENIEKLKTFINNNFNTNNIEINERDLNDHQREVIQGLLLGEYFFETSVEEYKYKIEYSKTDNLSYVIYFKDDKSILVKKLKINDDYDIVKIDTYFLNFSEENIDILNNYVENEVKNENNNTIYKYSTLKKHEISIIDSIIKNNESYLDNIDNAPKLSYTIFYNGIDCPTPYLYLYSDNTYEYYYTFSTGDEILVPKTGTYNYDIANIIDNLSKYEENLIGPYYIKDSKGNTYVTYNTNIELQELLKSINVTLEKCLEQQ